jgi:hypothetical protein
MHENFAQPAMAPEALIVATANPAIIKWILEQKFMPLQEYNPTIRGS